MAVNSQGGLFRALSALALISGLACADENGAGQNFPPFSAIQSDSPIRIINPADGQEAGATGDALVYSSTLGRESFDFFGTVGDDILMTGSPGCLLSRYRIRVDGDTNGGGIGPFSVNFALYRECPRLGPSIIPGTEGTADLPDEGEYLVEFVVPDGVDIPLPQSFWIAATFSRPSAGWVAGYPAEIGYSRNRYSDPIFGCNGLFGSLFPEFPYSAFYAEVFVREPCAKRFAGYRSTFPERSALTVFPGEIIADDLHLGVNDCLLAAYEIGLRDTGLVKVKLHQDAAGAPGAALAGSEAAFTTEGFGLQVMHHRFDPPIPVPQDLWISAELVEGAGLFSLVATPLTVGESEATIARYIDGTWVPQVIPDSQNQSAGLGLHVTLFCAGDAPLGACCDPYLPAEIGAASCRDVPEINCPFPPRGSTLVPQWKRGVACGANPFNPPCGSFACCRADGACENVPQAICFQNGVSWSEGVYCDGLSQNCEFVCIPSLEDCTAAHGAGGCSEPFCCREVCNFDDYCCEVEWDETCVLAVAQLCAIPPGNDECAADAKNGGATLVQMPVDLVLSDHRRATENDRDPGFCCHKELPGADGVGTVWYKFLATGPIAELSTCQSNSPASDSLLQLFAVHPHDPDESDCENLQVIGCNDDAQGCSFGSHNSRLCVNDLVPGQTYYVMVAAKTEETRGNYRLKIATSCTVAPFEICPCPAGSPQWMDPPSGVVDARSPRGPGAGIKFLVAFAPNGADRLECWSLCVNGSAPPAPDVQTLAQGSNGITQLLLTEPLSPGSAATLSYADGLGVVSTSSYFIHPGNVNADGVADAMDVLSLIAVLDDLEPATWGAYSTDIDDSGMLTPLDLWEQLNVLLGAELPDAWLNTSVPALLSCP